MSEKIIIGGVEFSVTHPHICKDAITGEYFHIRNSSCFPISQIILRSSPKLSNVKFDPESRSTWEFFEFKTTYLLNSSYTEYNRLLDEEVIELRIYKLGKVFLIPQFFETIAEDLDLVKGKLNDSVYYIRRELEFMDKPKPYRSFNNTYSRKKIEDILNRSLTKEDNSNSQIQELKKSILKRNLEMGVDSVSHIEFEGIKRRFGIELEFATGRLEEGVCDNINFKAVKDGSLREADGEIYGAELVSGVLYGDNGLRQVNEVCKLVQEHNHTINSKAGFHVHIGDLKWTREDVVYSYILAEMLEDEIFSILPKSRRSNEYCRKLTPIALNQLSYLKQADSTSEYQMRVEEVYNRIVAEVAGMRDFEPSRIVHRNTQHPKGSKCGYDKTAQRYCWLNYVTLLFDTKGVKDSHTLEVRNHSGTMSYRKIKNWIKIFMGFVSFVENHKNIIKTGFFVDKKGTTYPLTLELVIKLSFPKTSNALIDYVRERKEVFKTKTESIDYTETEDIKSKSLKQLVCA